MAKEPTTTEPRAKQTVAAVDFTKPFAVIFHQTDARNIIEVIEGDNCVEIAKEKASEIAIGKSRPVAVFGPQVAVKAPPAKEAADIPLSF